MPRASAAACYWSAGFNDPTCPHIVIDEGSDEQEKTVYRYGCSQRARSCVAWLTYFLLLNR